MEKSFFFSCYFWLKKVEDNQITNYFKIQNSKNRYIKIDNVFLATKTLSSNDTDPFGEKSCNPATQRNKKVWIAKNMVKRINLELEEQELKTMQ